MDLRIKALLKVKSDALFREMRAFGVAWHQEKKCSCMEAYRGEINERTYLPCEHLKEAQHQEFGERIDHIDMMFRTQKR